MSLTWERRGGSCMVSSKLDHSNTARSFKEAITLTLRRITRDQPLSSEEAAKYEAIRELIAEELPELIARHEERLAIRDGEEGQRP